MDSKHTNVAIVIILMTFQVTPSAAAGGLTPDPKNVQSCPETRGFLYPHPDSCSVYLSCQSGTFSLHQCPDDSSFSEIVGACVQFNSLFDSCTRNNAVRECRARQRGNVTLTIPYPSRCHQYLTCSPSQTDFFEFHICSYPDMFDMVERRCKPFKETFCGVYRKEYKDYCGDYVQQSCIRCRPCNIDAPSCVGLPDGFSSNPQKRWSPFYIVCDTERFMNESRCPDQNGITQLFHHDREQCVTPWEIPKEHGGYAPSCEGLQPGFHVVADKRDVYFQCPDEAVYYCDIGVFDNKLQTCA